MILRQAENLVYTMDFSIADTTFKDTGPVTLTFFVNDHMLDSAHYTAPGPTISKSRFLPVGLQVGQGGNPGRGNRQSLGCAARRRETRLYFDSQLVCGRKRAISNIHDSGADGTCSAPHSPLRPAMALGALIVDALGAPLRRAERFPLAFVLGASCLHLILFLVLALHIAYWPVLVAIPTRASASRSGKAPGGSAGEPMEPLGFNLALIWGAIFAVFTVVYFFNALQPEISPDGSSYHLGFIAHYMRAHGFVAITTNLYASLGQGIELLFLPAFVIGRHSAGALVHFGFLIAVCLAVFAYGRRLG